MSTRTYRVGLSGSDPPLFSNLYAIKIARSLSLRPERNDPEIKKKPTLMGYLKVESGDLNGYLGESS